MNHSVLIYPNCATPPTLIAQRTTAGVLLTGGKVKRTTAGTFCSYCCSIDWLWGRAAAAADVVVGPHDVVFLVCHLSGTSEYSVPTTLLQHQSNSSCCFAQDVVYIIIHSRVRGVAGNKPK